MATIKKMVMLQTGRRTPATPSGLTRSVMCATTLYFFIPCSFSCLLFSCTHRFLICFHCVNTFVPFLYSALFPPSDTSKSSSLAAREDEEVPRASSHNPRDVPCGGRRMQGENVPPTLCVTVPVPPPPGPLCCAAQLRVVNELHAAGEHTGDLHEPTTCPLRTPRACAALTPALCAHRALVLPSHLPSVRRRPALHWRQASRHRRAHL
jgi:hypothetical protein